MTFLHNNTKRPLYNIYALKYAGPLVSSGAFLLWLRDWDKQVKRNYYFWLCFSEDYKILVDTGVSPNHPEARKLPSYKDPIYILKRLDIDASQIHHIILTHLHWDHSSGLSLFPNATFYIQRQEYEFWTKDPLSNRPPFLHLADMVSINHLKRLEGTNRLSLIQGDKEILPGIRCVSAPGHSIGMQAVAVRTQAGDAVLGSDCGHTFQNYKEIWPSSIITNMVDWISSIDKLHSIVSSPDLLFPGHDIAMAECYNEIANDITILV